MKLSNIALISAALVSAAFAGDMKFGVVAGAGLSTFHGDDADDSEFALAYQVGAKVVLPMGGFNLAPEVIFAARGASAKDVTGFTKDASMNLKYVAIPILAEFEVAPSIVVKAGPQISILVASSFTNDGEDYDLEDDLNMEPSTLDVGLVAGAGYKINEQIGVDARFEYGFMEIAKDVKTANMGFGANVSYLF